MDLDKRRGALLVAAVTLMIAALAGGCGSPKENMPPASGASGATMAGMDICTTCHSNETSEWLNSGHANLDPTNDLTSYGVPTLGQLQASGTCATCHDPTGDSGNLTAGYTGNARPVVGCEACHGAGSLHVGQSGIGPISQLSNTVSRLVGTVQVSGQFVMCTACHELLDSSGTGTMASAHDSSGAEAASASGTQLVITDTHFATAGTYSATTNRLESPIPLTGYAMDYSKDAVCTQCHDPHGTADINRDWAESGHGDRSAVPWYRYNWSYSDYYFCQRCHTTTGFTNYADANAAGDTTTISNIWNGLVSNFTTSAGFKPEMLLCTGCHKDNRGTLRNPGAYNATYGFRTGSGSSAKIYAYASYQYPDASSSNVCILCHSGRNSGDTIHALNTSQAGTTATVNFGSQSSVSTPHDMTAAGVMFAAIGYEYSGRSYDNPSSYKHDQVGSAMVANTGTGGPCVGCHMYRSGMSANHLFSVATKSGDTITNVSSEVCYNCHAGSSTGLAATLENERQAFEGGLEALDTQLRFAALLTGSTFTSNTTTSNWLSPGDSDSTGSTTGKNNMGAAFNRSFLINEPGAFVHNSKYVKRLLYDSIDWLDDRDLNYSAGQTLNTICSDPTPSTWCELGMPYLLPNGVRPGASAERPY